MEAKHPIRLRLATLTDAPVIRDIYTPIVRDTAISFECEPPDTVEIADRVRRTLERLPWLVALGAISDAATTTAQDEAVLGYAYATPHRSRMAYRWSVEVSVYVAPAAWRRGIARRLYNSLFELLRAQNYQVGYAGITLPNPASVRMHEALGFQRIGVFPSAGFKLGRWHDVLWMRHELAPAASDPREPIPLSRLDPALIRDLLRR